MQSKENTWNVLHELQRGLLHLWTGFACLAGKFHILYEPSQFCSVFIVARCRSADWNLFMVHAWWCSTTFSSGSMRILERCVSETVDRTRWPNSMACPFPWFKSFSFLCLGTPKVCCLCYINRWWPGLATSHTEWIWDCLNDICLNDIWNFLVNQAITIESCDVLHLNVRWTLWTPSLIFRRP
jgi:hypothetical protein